MAAISRARRRIVGRLARAMDSARRVDSIAFTLEWEKGCANPPALLKEAAKPEKLKQI
jgi:hypothetical protein